MAFLSVLCWTVRLRGLHWLLATRHSVTALHYISLTDSFVRCCCSGVVCLKSLQLHTYMLQTSNLLGLNSHIPSFVTAEIKVWDITFWATYIHLVYRTWWQHYHSHYKLTSMCIVYESVNGSGWIYHEGAGILHHVEGHLDSSLY